MATPETVLLLLVVAHALVSAAPVWGPPLACGAAVVAWWRLRPSGRHRTPVRTSVRARVREALSHHLNPDTDTALTCVDIHPDMSADVCPALPGYDGEGAR